MKVDILISSNSKSFYPILVDGVTLEWHRKGAPGKLVFSVVKDGIISFTEGDSVKLQIDGKDMFFGFIFTKARNSKDKEVITVTAYDQLRYFKNKTSLYYENKKASDVVSGLASDFLLSKGEIEDTGYVIPDRTEDNSTLFDIVQNALDETIKNRGEMYVLYDDIGKLTLKNARNMRLGLLISVDTAGGYEYSSSIDRSTYNQVKITYDNKETGKRDVFLARDTENINRWGLLQHTEEVQNPLNGKVKAEAILKLYNSVFRTLTVTSAIGDTRVRAGSSVVVKFELGDWSVQNLMFVESVLHKFKDGGHLMDLKLRGGSFVV